MGIRIHLPLLFALSPVCRTVQPCRGFVRSKGQANQGRQSCRVLVLPPEDPPEPMRTLQNVCSVSRSNQTHFGKVEQRHPISRLVSRPGHFAAEDMVRDADGRQLCDHDLEEILTMRSSSKLARQYEEISRFFEPKTSWVSNGGLVAPQLQL
jgi:hypothetical protein